MTLRGAGLLLAVLVAAGAARAQEPAAPRLTLDVRRDSAGDVRGPIVQATGLPGGVFLGALRNGYPVRFGYQLQLWRDGRLVDQFEREASWEAVVILDPLTETYELLRSGGSGAETFNDQRSLEAALATPYAVDLLPGGRTAGRTYYYIATLTMESLSVSELEEIERWLRGDLGPSIGERDVNNALSRGARLLMIRLSGLPRRQLEARSPNIRY